jgi:transposase
MYLGVDIAKRKFDCALLIGETRFRTKVFDNNAAGIEACLAWIAKQSAGQPVHGCIEATGPYGEALACALHDAGHTVSVVNPARSRAYAESLGVRTKTDAVDARTLALMCKGNKPKPWTPPPASIRQLQELVRRLDALTEMHTQEVNRRGVAHEVVVASIEEMLVSLEKHIETIKAQIAQHIDQDPTLREQRDLLATIPGIGPSTTAWLIAELNAKQFACARQAAAYAGVTPAHRQSGTSVHGKPKLSKRGNGRLRKTLYWAAITALRHNAIVRAMGERLRKRGKHNMAIIAAAMRKLIHIAFGVLKSGRPFDPTLSDA